MGVKVSSEGGGHQGGVGMEVGAEWGDSLWLGQCF